MFCMYFISIEIYIIEHNKLCRTKNNMEHNNLCEGESLLDLESSENSNCYIRCSLIGFRVELKLELYIEYLSE